LKTANCVRSRVSLRASIETMPDFTTYPLAINCCVFAAAAMAVWFAGSRVAAYADLIGDRFRLNEALLGVLLLAGVTSLPEIATSLTAAHGGDAALAVNNLLGSIAMQVAVLALADFTLRHAALTSVLPDPIVILLGALNVALLAVVAIAAITGDTLVLGAGLWSWGLLAAAVLCGRILAAAQRRPTPWLPRESASATRDEIAAADENDAGATLSNVRLIGQTVAAAGAILLAGSIVALSGSAIAAASGLGSSFMGVAFVAIATSLPEVSTTLAAVARGRYTMAISNILGTNLLNVGLLTAVDLLAPGAAIFQVAGRFAAIGAMLGIVVTAVYIVGLAERSDRRCGRLGYDSIVVMLVYGGGMALLYTMRDTS
jgi:cation:H+ antiporter